MIEKPQRIKRKDFTSGKVSFEYMDGFNDCHDELDAWWKAEMVRVLEGLKYKDENDINNVHTKCAINLNKRINAKIKEISK